MVNVIRIAPFSLSLSLLLLIICGCSDNNNSFNKVESSSKFENVIKYFNGRPSDSLEQKAAAFLVENMQDKFFYEGHDYKRFLSFIDSISSQKHSGAEYKKAIGDFFTKYNTLVGDPKKVFDADLISSEFLIKNIQSACRIYKEHSSLNGVSFEDFCEHILPYKVGNEPPEEFRDSFYSEFSSLMVNKSFSIHVIADSVLSRTSKKEFEVMTFPAFVPDFPLSSLKKLRGGTCKESSYLAIYIMRSLGLPVADDFTPQWPHRGMGHSWAALLTGKDSCIDFEGANSVKVGNHLRALSSFKIAKAYRRTYAKQKASLAMLHDDEEIPEFFTNPYIKDVSKSYFEGINLRLSVSDLPLGAERRKFAYVCVFNNSQWIPIHWGQIKDEKVEFSNLGKNIVYMPAIYVDGRMEFSTHPILVDSVGNVKKIIADESSKQTLKLDRKYPVFDWWNTRLSGLVGAKFQVSNDPKFAKSENLFTIDDIPGMTFQEINVDLTKPYRFFRFLSADSSYGDIAEIEVYDKDDKPVNGQIISNADTEESTPAKAAFDGNALSYFQGREANGNWIGLKFQNPQTIKRIKYLPRNDDNFIRKGEIYELFIWKKNRWSSIAKKPGGDEKFLEFIDVPRNGLYLLRNITKGKEERIFTYQDSKQIWW